MLPDNFPRFPPTPSIPAEKQTADSTLKPPKRRFVRRLCCILSVTATAACSPAEHNVETPGNTAATAAVSAPGHTVRLGNADACARYLGLPKQWRQHPHAGMVHIKGGSFDIGSEDAYPEEFALKSRRRTVGSFWIDATEVTNAQFQSFVDETGYVTEAEQQGEAAVFIQPRQAVPELGWWKLVKGANWKQPWGANARQTIEANEPVRMITLKDAEAYAAWLGRELPTEEQWEYAAKGFSPQRDIAADRKNINANTWHGEFPYRNDNKDGHTGVAPVGCYPANGFGLFDTIGNVWEYTRTPFAGSHDDHMGINQIHGTHIAHSFNSYVIKGGSFLCAENYCMRYRAAARHPQEKNLAISHVGFRTVKASAGGQMR
ncbi:MAG: formylglycine-generating enzyme family protein [Neisseria zoodegmatis]|uniref:formylglycine-generating enzyme family protein n=1 Tax=Neisseria zoodegmatis TaxID=326523 RepID=UPI0026EF9489|nr:formylglycine-generating enzyme family protein [Neisseria zoodegmatis]MDO5070344.1 formylglycine-generating enzyme family protein [Neisseria zoodegmatis]